jgi:hypothetical protein
MSKFLRRSSRSRSSEYGAFAFSIPAAFTALLVCVVLAPALRAKFTRRSPVPFRRATAFAKAQAGATNAGISGQVVDAATAAAISGGTVVVALEQADGTGTDVVFTQASADSTGRFSFVSLPLASTFDVVAVAVAGGGPAYNATVVVGVPVGTDLGDIPLVAEHGGTPGPATLQGYVTSSASPIRATVSALQSITLAGGVTLPVNVPQTVTISGSRTRLVTIPSEGGSSANLTVRSGSSCPEGAPPNTNCAQYTLVEPPSNPSVALFVPGKITYAQPDPGPALYSVRGNAFSLGGLGGSDCIPSFQTASLDASGEPLKVAPGARIASPQIDFTGCW